MIKYFRKIRQTLISENKFTKYMIYAIGEIVLVTIGIFLAIQANQWKQDINRKNLEIKLLKEVQIGIQNDSTDVDINLYENGHMQYYYSQKKCIAWLRGEYQDLSADSLKYHFSYAFKHSSSMITSSPFDGLKEFGLNNISNDSLKKEIQYLYDVMYPEYKRAHNLYFTMLEKTLEKGENYFDDWSWWGRKVKINDIEAIKKDNVFLFTLIRLHAHNRGLIYYNLEIQKRQRRILEMLDYELMRKG